MSGPGAGGGIQFIFNVAGVEYIDRTFETMRHVVDDLSPVWPQIAADMASDVAWNFESEGAMYDHEFGGWDALADSTVRERERLGYGGEGPIERRTGALAESFQIGGAGNIAEYQPQSMLYGSTVFYAGYQHYGTRKMPPRPLLGMTQDRQKAIVQAVGDYIRQKIRGA